MKKLKVGQIGIGHNHAQAIMAAIRKFTDLFEIVGVCEENEEWLKNRQHLPEYKGLSFIKQEQIIERCDVIFVETDVWNILKTAKKCVDCGKHIHIDKPIMGSLDEFAELLNTAKEKGLIVQSGYMYRDNPAVKKCMEIIKSGALGEILSINAEMSTRHDKNFRNWLNNFPCGNMFIFGSHFVDLIVFLLGEPSNITTVCKSSEIDGVLSDDICQTILSYPKSMARIYTSSVEYNGWERRQLVVSGSKGTIEIRPMENPCRMFYSDSEIETNPYSDMKKEIFVNQTPMNCRYDDMVKDFYAYVTGATQNPYDYSHEYSVYKVLSKIVNNNKNIT